MTASSPRKRVASSKCTVSANQAAKPSTPKLLSVCPRAAFFTRPTVVQGGKRGEAPITFRHRLGIPVFLGYTANKPSLHVCDSTSLVVHAHEHDFVITFSKFQQTSF